MLVDDEIRDTCKRLISSDNEADVTSLARQLRLLLSQWTQEVRSQVRILPMLETQPNRKKKAA